MNDLFTGEFDTVLFPGEGESKVIPADNDLEDPIVIPPKNVTELDRLSYVVRKIEADCHVVPRGSFKLTPIHEIKKNEAFRGLA